MTLDHAALRELAAGAALDDLDGDELVALSSHLSTCVPCRALQAELDDVMGDLALIAPTLHAPASLRADVMAALREPPRYADAPLRQAAAPQSIAAPRFRLGTWMALGAAAVLGVAAVGLAGQVARLDGELDVAQAAAAEAQQELQARQAAIAVIADPTHVTAPLEPDELAPGTTAMVVFTPGTTDAYLMAVDLPATPAGHVYQLWFADAAGVHPLETFHHDGEGAFVAGFGVDLASSAAAMVTLEPEGGVQGEPGPQVVFGEF